MTTENRPHYAGDMVVVDAGRVFSSATIHFCSANFALAALHQKQILKLLRSYPVAAAEVVGSILLADFIRVFSSVSPAVLAMSLRVFGPGAALLISPLSPHRMALRKRAKWNVVFFPWHSPIVALHVVWGKPIMGFSALIAGVICVIRAFR